MEEMLTTQEAARLLKVSQRTILTYIKKGQLEAVNIGSQDSGRRWRIPQQALNDFIERNKPVDPLGREE